MAIIVRGKSKCSICGETLQDRDDIVATQAFVSDPEDPLWPHSDAGIHRDCFAAWNRREAFVEKYNATVGQVVWGNGTRHHMLADGSIKVSSVGEDASDA